jgi:hypothetical protein
MSSNSRLSVEPSSINFSPDEWSAGGLSSLAKLELSFARNPRDNIITSQVREVLEATRANWLHLEAGEIGNDSV